MAKKKVIGNKTIYYLPTKDGEKNTNTQRLIEDGQDKVTCTFRITKVVLDEDAVKVGMELVTKEGKLHREVFLVGVEDEEKSKATIANLKRLVKTAMLIDQSEKFDFNMLGRCVGKYVIADVVKSGDDGKGIEKFDPFSYYQAENFDSVKWEDELVDTEELIDDADADIAEAD